MSLQKKKGLNMFNNYVAVLKKYVEFSGRATRSEFWWFVLANFLVSLLVGFVGGMIGVSALGMLYSLAVLLPSLAVGARRLRDAGFSPWLLLLLLVPIANIALIILWIMPSKK